MVETETGFNADAIVAKAEAIKLRGDGSSTRHIDTIHHSGENTTQTILPEGSTPVIFDSSETNRDIDRPEMRGAIGTESQNPLDDLMPKNSTEEPPKLTDEFTQPKIDNHQKSLGDAKTELDDDEAIPTDIKDAERPKDSNPTEQKIIVREDIKQDVEPPQKLTASELTEQARIDQIIERRWEIKNQYKEFKISIRETCPNQADKVIHEVALCLFQAIKEPTIDHHANVESHRENIHTITKSIETSVRKEVLDQADKILNTTNELANLTDQLQSRLFREREEEGK